MAETTRSSGPESFRVDSRAVFAIAVPMTLAFITTPLIGSVDTAVVGQFGDAALIGGIAVGGLIFDVLFSTCNFLRSGTTGITAQGLGAGDRRLVAVTFLRALTLALAIGLVIVLLRAPLRDLGLMAVAPSRAVAAATARYFDIRVLAAPLTLTNYVILGWMLGLGRAGAGLFLQSLLNGVNVALSVILGLGLGWGLEGAAWGTVIAETVAAMAGGLLVWRVGRGGFRPALAHVFERAGFGRMLAVNRDIMIRSFALLASFTIFTRMGAGFGDVTLAANAVLLTFFMVGSYFLDGLATAAEQLSGRAIGAGRRDAFDGTVRLAVAWGLALSAVASLIVWLAGPALIALMAADGEVRATAGLYLPWAALTPLVGTLAFQMDGVFIGATWSREMRNMMLASLAGYVALLATLGPHLGNHGLWISFLAFLGLRGLTLLLRLGKLTDAAFGDDGGVRAA